MKNYLVLFSLLLIAIIGNAQVYYFQYVKTEGGDVIRNGNFGSWSMKKDIYVIFISDEWMDYVSDSRSSFVQHISGDKNYWHNKVINEFIRFAEIYTNPPTNEHYAFTHRYPPSWESLKLVFKCEGYMKNSALSDSRGTTFTLGYKPVYTDGPSPHTSPKYWWQWTTDKINFSFSSDMSTLKIWSTDNPNNRIVYTQMDANSVIPDDIY